MKICVLNFLLSIYLQPLLPLPDQFQHLRQLNFRGRQRRLLGDRLLLGGLGDAVLHLQYHVVYQYRHV